MLLYSIGYIETSAWQGSEVWGICRKVAITCDPLSLSSNDNEKTVVGSALDEMVIGAVYILCEFSLLVSSQNHHDLSLKALDNPLNNFAKKMHSVQLQKVSQSAKPKVDEMLTSESYLLNRQKIDQHFAAVKVYVTQAAKPTIRNPIHSRFHLNGV